METKHAAVAPKVNHFWVIGGRICVNVWPRGFQQCRAETEESCDLCCCISDLHWKKNLESVWNSVLKPKSLECAQLHR